MRISRSGLVRLPERALAKTTKCSSGTVVQLAAGLADIDNVELQGIPKIN